MELLDPKDIEFLQKDLGIKWQEDSISANQSLFCPCCSGRCSSVKTQTGGILHYCPKCNMYWDATWKK